MKRNASVYRRGNVLILQPFSTTTAGVGIATPPSVTLDAGASPEMIGLALVQAMQESRSEVPHPLDWKGVGGSLLAAAKVRSWSAFARGTLCCEVSDNGKFITLRPTINEGRKGFVHCPGDELSIPSSSSPEQIGTAVRKALELSS